MSESQERPGARQRRTGSCHGVVSRPEKLHFERGKQVLGVSRVIHQRRSRSHFLLGGFGLKERFTSTTLRRVVPTILCPGLKFRTTSEPDTLDGVHRILEV